MLLFDRIVRWEEKLALRRSAVLFVTLWMTWRGAAWAMQYASGVSLANGESALGAAALIGAVTAPITVLQGYVFKSYIDSKTS